jgi:DNA helicase TIP49 (TBP-interacting protein)
MNYCISYIQEENFPADLVQKVKGSYPADEIFSIKEITTEEITMHEIVLQNSQHYTVISLTPNGIAEIRKIKRS